MKQNKLKIAVVVHGRFQAFGLVQALINQGHSVRLFTNYPKWAVKKFGIHPNDVQGFWLHGIISRLVWILWENIKLPYPEAWLHRMFGWWAARKIKKEPWDVIHCWSGVAEEVLQALRTAKALKILMRSSSHIRTQKYILEEEEKRTNILINKPSQWMIAREEREYALVDYIRVLSKFAYMSFVEEGVAPQKLLFIPAGTSIKDFRPSFEIVKERYGRIINGEPLRVLYVGSLLFRKGMWDMAKIVEGLSTERFQFRFVGPTSKETKEFLVKSRYSAEFIPKQPQNKLPKWYAWADLFVFPTLEDGHAQVLAQAQAAGLPVLSTTNCQGPDVIIEGKTGWILPIRNPEVFVERLLWCDSHRNELAQMTRDIYKNFKPKNWSEVAENFVETCKNILKQNNIRR